MTSSSETQGGPADLGIPRTGRELEKTSALLAAAVENSALAIVTIDSAGIVQAFNPAASALFGYRPDEVLGQNVALLMPSPYREEHDGYVARYLATGEARIIGKGRDVVARRKDGTVFPCRLSVGRVVFDGQLWFTGFIEDITEKQRAEQSQRLLSSIVQSSDAAIVAYSLDGTVISWNKGAADMYGYSAYEMVGQSIALLVPDDRVDELSLIRERLLRGERVDHLETVRLCKGGRAIDVMLFISPLLGADGRVIGAAAIARDVTERNRMARQLLEQKSLARLGEMAAVVAHEVRNPLAGIRGALAVLQQRLASDGDRHVMEEVIERITRLSQTLDELLLFARPRPPRPTPLEVEPLLDDAVRTLRDDPTWSGVDIVVEIEGERGALPVLHADRALLSAALGNLLLNAAQAVDGKGRVVVRARPHGERLHLQVQDDGPGIPADLRERVAEPFVTTKVKGTGLGLSVVKRVVETHGGTLAFGDAPGGGALVTIELPVAGPAGRHLLPDGRARAGRHPPGA